MRQSIYIRGRVGRTVRRFVRWSVRRYVRQSVRWSIGSSNVIFERQNSWNLLMESSQMITTIITDGMFSNDYNYYFNNYVLTSDADVSFEFPSYHVVASSHFTKHAIWSTFLHDAP